MSDLRTRMIRDMALREFSPRTHQADIGAVVGLAKYYGRSPAQMGHMVRNFAESGQRMAQTKETSVPQVPRHASVVS